MKTLASEILDATQELSQKESWIHLYDVEVEEGYTLHITDYYESIFYGGEEYIPYPITHDDIHETLKPEVHDFTITIAILDRAIPAYLENRKLLGNIVIIHWVMLRHEQTSP